MVIWRIPLSDFLQFPPVNGGPLYRGAAFEHFELIPKEMHKSAKEPTENKIDRIARRKLWQEVDEIAVLTKQMCTEDVEYDALLDRLRHGKRTHMMSI